MFAPPQDAGVLLRELSYIVSMIAPHVLICGPEFTDVLAEMRPDIDVAHFVAVNGAEFPDAIQYEDMLAQGPAEPLRPELDSESPYFVFFVYKKRHNGNQRGPSFPQRHILWNCINTVVSWGLTEKMSRPCLRRFSTLVDCLLL
ncbi:MAG: hypothetical protein R3C44_24135 [Chloroflexota bacterium]